MKLSVRRFDAPDETISFAKGSFEKVTVGEMTLGRARYQPGWKWSEHVGPASGTPSCPVEHVGLVLSGRAAIRMDDGAEMVVAPGDIFSVPPGHDSWVVGEESYVSIHLAGAGAYAARKGGAESSAELVCRMDALTAQEHARHAALVSQLRPRIEERREMPHGYAFRFPPDAAVLAGLAEWMALERLCCPFLGFELALEGPGPLWLKLTGPTGVKDFLLAELHPDAAAR